MRKFLKSIIDTTLYIFSDTRGCLYFDREENEKKVGEIEIDGVTYKLTAEAAGAEEIDDYVTEYIMQTLSDELKTID